MADESDEDLLAELGATIELKPERTHTPREERVIAGFEDILRFVETYGRAPLHGEGRDIFERLYAVRLDRLRSLGEYHALLAPLDVHGLLSGAYAAPPAADRGEVDEDDALLADLGVVEASEDAITQLRHVRSTEEKRAAEEIANRTPCADFKAFKPLFATIQKDLDGGARTTRRFGENAEIRAGEFFILAGQLAYVADVGDEIRAPNGERDARLRVIFGNGTESNMLRRSLQRALYKDETGRRVTEPSAGPLFGSVVDDDDQQTGTIYVLRSKSDDPYIAAHRDLIHKIGVTGGDVKARIAHAANDATYLLAEVEIVATYKLFNINRVRLENLLHRVFAPARLDVAIHDRFGKPVQPREWFLAPLSAIDEVVERVKDGSIVGYVYDPTSAALAKGEAIT